MHFRHEKSEEITGVITNCKSKSRQYNSQKKLGEMIDIGLQNNQSPDNTSQKKMEEMIDNGLQNTTQKTAD